MLSRVARMREINLDAHQLVYHIARLCSSLAKLGWNRSAFRYLIFSVQGLPSDNPIFYLRLTLQVRAKLRGHQQAAETLAST